MKKWMKRVVLASILLTILCGGIYYVLAPKKIEVYSVSEPANFHETVDADGYIAAKNSHIVVSELPGKLTLFVNEGDEVKMGQKVASIDSEDIRFELGQIDSQIRLQKIQVDMAALEMEEAKKSFEVLEKLFQEGGASKIELEDARTLWIMKEKYLRLQQTQLNALSDGSSQKANISSKLQKMTIFSTGNGIVTDVVSDGTVIMAGMKIMKVIDNSKKIVTINFPAESITALWIGKLVTIQYDELEVKKQLTGKVTRISGFTNTKQSALGLEEKYILVEVLPEKELSLPIGYKIQVQVVTKNVNAMVIPTQSIFEVDGLDYVFVVKGQIALKQRINKGIEIEDKTEVKEGLSPGDLVILKPNDSSIEENTRVRY